MTDEEAERKAVLNELVGSTPYSRSEILNLDTFLYKDQLRKKMEEDMAAPQLKENN